MEASEIPTGWIRLPHKGLLPRRRSGADQLHLYYTSEMDNLLVLAGHFNGPLLGLLLIPEEPLLLLIPPAGPRLAGRPGRPQRLYSWNK